MKRIVFVALAGLVGLCSSATDRFYIEDFTIVAGETVTVSILLENEVAYTAFQTDIYLPEGLTVEQEDGDYIFDLTSRKARDHNIASQTQADGAIRVMSYSPSIKAYSGNSGALVTFYVTASEDFISPGTIFLKNILFTTVAGSEVAFGDEACAVGTGSKGDVNNDGIVNIADVTELIDYLLHGDASLINLLNADVDQDGEVKISDVTSLIDILLYGEN